VTRQGHNRHVPETEIVENPLRQGVRAFMRARELATAQRRDEAVRVLADAVAAGCRYKKEWLAADAALAPLLSEPEFARVAERANAQYETAAAAAKPHLTFAVPDTLPDAFGYPLLMVLHGNNSNAKETAPHWMSMADKGWVVAVPQSTEIGMSPDGYTWNDREGTAKQLDLQFDRVKRATEIDASRIVLAGFSMGATQAIALALTKRFMVRGVVPIAAWLPHIEEFTALVEGGAAKMLRAYVVVGSTDASRDGAAAFVDLLQRHKIKAQLDVREGLGHEYPADMETTLETALAFATK
jgi:poly(3-hydroxybutyrate) depolymerase